MQGVGVDGGAERVAGGVDELVVVSREVVRVLLDFRHDLAALDARRNAPGGAEDHMPHVAAQDRRLVTGSLADHHAHGELLVVRVAGTEAELGDVDDDAGRPDPCGSPSPALEGPLDLLDALGERGVQLGERLSADDAVGLEAVTGLELPHGVDHGAVVERPVHLLVGVEIAEAAEKGRQPGKGVIVVPRRELRHDGERSLAG